MKTLFKISYFVIIGIGFILFLFLLSLGLFSFIYFSHEMDQVNQTREIEIVEEEKVKYFSAYGEDELRIEIEFYDKQSDNYLIAYAYYYFDKYQENIHLLDFGKKVIVTIDKNRSAFLTNL